VAGDSVGSAGGDPVFVTAEKAARDLVGGTNGDPVVAVAEEAASDSTRGACGDLVVVAAGEASDLVGGNGRLRWRSGCSRGGGVGG